MIRFCSSPLVAVACLLALAPTVAQTAELRFKDACISGTRITLAVASDILLHRPVRLAAEFNMDKRIRDPEERVRRAFELVFHRIRSYIERADIAYANLEGTLARNCGKGVVEEGGRRKCKPKQVDPATVYDEDVYTTYPRFNFPAATAMVLKRIGFDVIGTANNHALDRLSNGLDMTLDELEKVGLVTVGTVRYKDLGPNGHFPEDRRFVIYRKNGVSVGFIAMSYGSNFHDTTGQVLKIDKCLLGDCRDAVNDIRRLRARSDVDIVVVGLHWGSQHKPKPNRRQVEVARLFLDAGADLIVGGHPHRIQPWELYRTKDGRDTLILYSLGDLTGSWTEWVNRTGVIVYLGITKPATGKAVLNGVRVLPAYHHKTVYPPTKKLPYQSFVLGKKTPHRQPYDLVVENFGSDNLIEPEAPLVTNPHCPR